jgi:hypothetical protein
MLAVGLIEVAIVSKEDKFIFIHIPKNGGLSISKSIRQSGKGCEIRKGLDIEDDNIHAEFPLIHAGYSRINELVDLKEYKTAAFVRNPWDRMYSYFTMITIRDARRKKPPRREYSRYAFKKWLLKNEIIKIGKSGKKTITETIPFRAATKRKPKNYQFMGISIVDRFQTVPQSYWIEKDGEIVVDFIGRYENFREDYKRMMKECLNIDHPPKLAHIHNSNKGDYRKAYDQEMIDFIAEHNKKDIDRFKFSF